MKSIYKKIINIAVFIILFFSCGKIIEFAIYYDHTYARAMLYEFYSHNDLDTIFLGSSHTYASFNTEYLNDNLEINAFNLGTGDQQLDGSLYLLKEATKNNDIKTVYLDLYFRIAFDKPYKQRTGSELGYCYTISDNTKWSFDKYDYLINISSKENYIINFIPARRRWNRIFDFQYIHNNIKTKLSEEYRTYQMPQNLFGESEYKGLGYCELSTTNESFFRSGRVFEYSSLNEMNPDWEKSLSEIINFCKINDIQLILVVTPMPDFLLADMTFYDDYINYVRNIANDSNVSFYDFNLCKSKYLNLEREDFYDETHLSGLGAKKFNMLFADFLNGKYEVEEIFYNSYFEKLEKEQKSVFGLILYNNDNIDNMYIYPVTNVDLNNISYDTDIPNSYIENGKIYINEDVKGDYYINCYINGIQCLSTDIEL